MKIAFYLGLLTTQVNRNRATQKTQGCTGCGFGVLLGLPEKSIEAPLSWQTYGCPDVNPHPAKERFNVNPNEARDPDQHDSSDSAELDRPQRTKESEEVKAARHRAEWLPLTARALDPETLAKVEPHARSAVEAAGPTTVSDVQRMLRASFGINTWALDNMGFLNPETVWHPETVRIFVDDINGHQSVDTRQELGRTLKAIGRAVNERFWPAELEKLPKSGPAVAYDATGEAAMRLAPFLKGEPGRPEELAVAGCSLGGGMNAPQIRLAMPSDVIDMGNGRVGIQVRGTHPRLVPIRADYTDLVLRAVEFAGDGPFIRAASRNAVFIAAERVMVHGFGHLEFARARSTWLKAHLEAGTSLPALRAIAGPLSMNTLDALIGPISEALTPEAAAVEGLEA